jgi:hypothetical protein
VDLERLKEWLSVFQDFLVMAIATFIAVFGTLRIHEPTVLAIVLGFAGTLLGVPAFKRFDTRRRNSSEDGEDKWSHLP